MAYVPNSGSVVAFQGTVPWSVLGAVTNVGSIVSVNQGSIATVIIGGSIAASFTPPANQSVSGTIQTDVRGSVATVIIGGSIAASFTPPANQSVSGTVGASLIGLSPVSVSNFPTTQNVSGSVVATQGTNPWIITGSVQGGGVVNQSVSGTVNTLPIGTIVTSLVSTVPSSVIVGTSIFGQLPAGTAMLGSVAAYQGAVPWAMAGSVAAFQAGTQMTSLVSTVPSSVIVGASIFGTVPVTQVTNPWTVVSSIAGGIFPISGSVAATIVGTPNVNTAGSVVAFQGTSPWVVNFQNSSILAVPVGSIQNIWLSPSIVGSYAEDAAHTSGDKGIFTLNVRNDTLSSVTSTDGDYGFISVGPAGEAITANAPLTKWVSGISSVFTTTSQVALAAQGTSVFTYITGVQIANMSANQVLVTFGHGSNSILGFTTAPANGGSNIVMPNAWKTVANGPVTASISGGVASVYISMQGFTAKI